MWQTHQPKQPEPEAAQTPPQSAQADPDADVSDSLWYIRRAPDNDEATFQRLLAAMRTEYASPDFNPERAVWDDHSCRGLTTYPFTEAFTPQGLLAYASKIRGPFTFNGKLTIGGSTRARFILCRERLLAGAITNREPVWEQLKDHMSPIAYEIKVGRV